MIRIACLHAAASNVALFDRALIKPVLADVTLHHEVRADLLQAVEAAGSLTPALAEQTIEALLALAADADVVLLTCSTLGPAARIAALVASVPILRADAALAQLAVRDGGRVSVLCTAPSTLDATTELFERAAGQTGAEIRVQLVAGAWDRFRSGDEAGYLDLIARAARAAWQDGATQVALAQASMAPARQLVTPEPLDLPSAAVAAALVAAWCS